MRCGVSVDTRMALGGDDGGRYDTLRSDETRVHESTIGGGNLRGRQLRGDLWRPPHWTPLRVTHVTNTPLAFYSALRTQSSESP